MTSELRLNEVRDRMAREEIDLIVLGPGAHLRWLTGLAPHADERPLLFCLTPEKHAFLMPELEADSLRQHTDLPFYEWSDVRGPDDAFARLLNDLGAGSARAVALDETMRADFAGLVRDALPRAAYRFSHDTVGAGRMRKDAGEYACLKRNARIADTAMRAAWAGMSSGMRETDVAGIVRESFGAQGAEPLFHIIGAGRNGAFPHHQTGDATLKSGDAVVMDIGGAVGGYSSDITRMAVIGRAPDGYDEIHAIVDRAVQAALAAARPGVPARTVDRAARDVIAGSGYGAHFLHRTGHGMGIEVHENPYITAGSDAVLDVGMVFSIEPGIYLPGRFGVRLEEIVILRADGPEILSDLPRDAVIVDG